MPPILRRLLDTEPVALVGVIVAVAALLGVTVADDDVARLVQVLAFVLPLLGAGAARQLVTPNARALTGTAAETTAVHGVNPELIDDGDTR